MNDEYTDVFINESKDYINKIREDILLLDKNITDINIIDDIFRILHSIKGMCGMMGFQEMYEYTHSLESIIQPIKNNEKTLNKEIINNITNGINKYEKMVNKIKKQTKSTETTQKDTVSIESLFGQISKTVSQLEAETGKDINIEIDCNMNEIQSNIINKITEMVVQLLRNSIDHGIEMPEIRQKIGKEKEGKVKVEILQKTNELHINVSDDGTGIDLEKVKEKAIQKGLIKSKNITDQEAINILFLPGFTTMEKITTVSGRGYGLDVVKEDITKMGGKIEVETEKNKGTKIEIVVPT